MAGLSISQNQRTHRGLVNPLDKATIVSIYPKEIVERKETIQPGIFKIAAGSESNPSVLVVGPSSWWREIDQTMPLIELPNNSLMVAESVVKDFCNGMIECDMDSAMPGLMFVPGEFTPKEIVEKFSIEFNRMVAKQKQWFLNLVKSADADWAKFNGNPRSISDLAKMAARELGLEDRDWMKSTVNAKMVKCAACGNLRNPEFPICGTCNRIIDQALAKKLGILDSKSA